MDGMRLGSTTVDLSVDYDAGCNESLFELWKITNSQVHCPKISSTQRLNNRSWRMLNQKILLNNSKHADVMKDLYSDSLSDLKPRSSQFLSSRPSLFLNTSRSTLFSHSSRNSFMADKSSTVQEMEDKSADISEISDISDISEEEDDPSSDDEGQDKKISESAIQKISSSGQPEPNFAFGYFPPQIDPKVGELPEKPPLSRSKTSFVRGFSPRNVSVASLSIKSKEPMKSPENKGTTNIQGNSHNNENAGRTKNIFYIANSPSPPQNNHTNNTINNPSHNDKDHANRSDPSTSISNTKPPVSGMKRQDSLFNNLLGQHNIQNSNDDDYSSTDISEVDDNESLDEDHLDTEENDAVSTVCDDKSNSTTILGSNTMDGNSKKSPIAKGSDMIIKEHGKSHDNDSEWLSISSEDEKACEVAPREELVFDKRQTSLSNNTSTSTDIIPANGNDDLGLSPPMSKPRSLLSSLFLNEMATSSSASLFSMPNSKPLLKRSSTTGIITINQTDNAQNPLNKRSSKINKPSILFSKKHTSMTDISKNYPHYQNELVQKDILNDQNDEDDEDAYLGKQKSMVGISDFNVMTNSKNISTANSINNESNSNGCSADHEDHDNSVLASSLNKYSYNRSSHSIKNLLSRSSLNLGHFLNSKMKPKRDLTPNSDKNNMLRPALHSNGSQKVVFSTNSVSPSSLPISPDSRVTSNQIKKEKLDIYTNNDASNNFNNSSKSNSTNSNAHTSDSPQAMSSHPVAKSESNLCTDNGANTATTTRNSIKLSPKSTRRSMLSTELSNSLKESILIDYKLGKVPLPLKVIDDGEFINKNPDANESLDDYHLRGW